jgi:hypothetical protein
VFGVAALGLVSAYVMFLGSFIYPMNSGLDTRLHVFAGLAFAALSYAVLVIVTEILPLQRGAALAIVTGASLALALGFADRLRTDIDHWDDATVAQRELLSGLRQAVPPPANGSRIFSFGFPGEAWPGIPIFTHYWDMNGAVRLTFNDPSLYGLPIYRPGGIVCDKAFVYPTSFGMAYGSRYGRAIFVDVLNQRTVVIRSQSGCKAAMNLFRPGPRERSSS